MQTTYQKLTHLSKEIHTYHSILSLLHWDQETYMPSGATTPRSEQIALLSHLIHEMKVGPTFKRYLSALIDLKNGKVKAKGLKKNEHVALKEWRREFLRATKLPSTFVKEFSELTSQASAVWAEAKKSGNFNLFAPFLEKIVQLNQKKAELYGYDKHPYDALLSSYEPSLSTTHIETIFGRLQTELKNLLIKISNSPSPKTAFLEKEISAEKQWHLGTHLLSKLPMDPIHSRLDRSIHPFSTALHPYDSRITSRILPNRFFSNLSAILHETGHSLYEMGLPVEYFGTPLAEAISLSIHESQSRFWETLIGLSLPFWKFFYPYLQKELPHLKRVPLTSFYRGIHRVQPSLIRVEADEVTYCLHIILRFDLEKRLISGTLKVADLPDAWNQKMKELLGITPSNHSEGCLQDIHWSLGAFGYFPTYALGNLFAAQFFSAFAKENPKWEERVSQGDLLFVREWLREKIHCHGKTYTGEELVKKVTGKPLSEDAYCSYLKKKYNKF
ncbi:MAG TPA: carboxypeptidase M32 [Chlamydiales bacterium]|nr:MAG: carboxypeptidase [Verrucomicrobia bacterium RIFCSPHIGHO2_12_FULL_41_10]HLB53012.1 carboxypeptidase M32 [Chlamydiales bacterium]